MKIKFWLLAASTALALMGSATSCKNEDPGTDKPKPPVELTDAENAELIKWIDEYMAESYLWNTEYKTLTLDKEQNYEDFLKAALDGVSAQGNVNKEDGHWTNNKRDYYYSNITSREITKGGGTRSTLGVTEASGYGITSTLRYAIGEKYYLVVLGVVPSSPAAEAGLTRATYITRVDGTLVSLSNMNELQAKLTASNGSSVKLSYVTITLDKDNNPITSDVKTTTLKAKTYTDTPILYSAAFRPNSAPQYRVGYIAYDLFNYAFDKDLIAAFDLIQKTSRASLDGDITDMILDLRYNSGGNLKTSVMLATLLTGDSKKGELYCTTTMNADRMAKMEPQEYRIGQKKIAENDGGEYELIETALKSAFNLKRVFVFTGPYTASASELIINGLRGMGIEVNLIGLTTNGKNVGMESQIREIGNHEYAFAPITFRLENAQGFGDYSSGFKPDVEVDADRGQSLIGNYGTGQDLLFLYAVAWISEGKKPEVAQAAPATRSAQIRAIGEPVFAKPRVGGAIMSK